MALFNACSMHFSFYVSNNIKKLIKIKAADSKTHSHICQPISVHYFRITWRNMKNLTKTESFFFIWKKDSTNLWHKSNLKATFWYINSEFCHLTHLIKSNYSNFFSCFKLTKTSKIFLENNPLILILISLILLLGMNS